MYAGSRQSLDKEIVLKAGLPFTGLFSGKFRRYFDRRNFTDPFLLIAGFFQSLFLLLRFWPQVIFLTGGYVSVPMVLAGFLLRRPLILQESDAAMGLANRFAAFFARRVLVAYPHAYAGAKALWVGNPVRPEMLLGKPEEGWKMTGFTPGKPVLLVMGGSLGAQRINELIISVFPALQQECQMVHITGAGKQTDLRLSGYVQFSYLDEDLPSIYAIADVIIARAGANTLAEIALLAKPAFIIPLPHSAQDNQMKNARYYECAGACLILNQEDLTPEMLIDRLRALLHNPIQQEAMRRALCTLARPEAGERIAKIVLNSG